MYWTGVAGYVKYALNSNTAFSTRYEYYNDHDGFTSGVRQHFNEFTTTFERVVAGHIISRFEFRRDMSNEPYFLKGVNPVTDQNAKQNSSHFRLFRVDRESSVSSDCRARRRSLHSGSPAAARRAAEPLASHP